jgi:hypothetical protein
MDADVNAAANICLAAHFAADWPESRFRMWVRAGEESSVPGFVGDGKCGSAVPKGGGAGYPAGKGGPAASAVPNDGGTGSRAGKGGPVASAVPNDGVTATPAGDPGPAASAVPKGGGAGSRAGKGGPAASAVPNDGGTASPAGDPGPAVPKGGGAGSRAGNGGRPKKAATARSLLFALRLSRRDGGRPSWYRVGMFFPMIDGMGCDAILRVNRSDAVRGIPLPARRCPARSGGSAARQGTRKKPSRT